MRSVVVDQEALEWVESWDRALPMLAALRGMIAAPCIGLTTDGRRVEVPSYTRWWLSSRPVLSGRRPMWVNTRA